MQSKSRYFPEGMGNRWGELGTTSWIITLKQVLTLHLMVFKTSITLKSPRRLYIPRFRNLGGDTNLKDFIRGYGYQGDSERDVWPQPVKEMGYGADLNVRCSNR